MKILRLLSIMFLIVGVLSFTSCNKDDASGGTSSISVKLMDAPGDYEEVNIEVIDVKVKYAASENIINEDVNGEDANDDGDVDNQDGEWVSLNAINTGVHNLLDLTGGIDVLLVDGFEIPSGMLEEIRLVLGDNNSIKLTDPDYPDYQDLKTPSAQQSGLKIKVNELLQPNYSYTFLLDFDADKSIVMAGGSDNINLKPVIRASVEALTGAISGQILPIGVQTEVMATQDGVDTISTFVDAEGYFLLVGTTPGTYTVTFTPAVDSGLEVEVIEDISVSLEQTTDMGIIDLSSE